MPVPGPDDLPLYPIRTVAALTGVDARRLRSWETEYRLLQPSRSKGGHRLYSRRDLELVRLIRRLVEEEGMSLQAVGAWLAAHPGAPGTGDGHSPAVLEGAVPSGGGAGRGTDE